MIFFYRKEYKISKKTKKSSNPESEEETKSMIEVADETIVLSDDEEFNNFLIKSNFPTTINSVRNNSILAINHKVV